MIAGLKQNLEIMIFLNIFASKRFKIKSVTSGSLLMRVYFFHCGEKKKRFGSPNHCPPLDVSQTFLKTCIVPAAAAHIHTMD